MVQTLLSTARTVALMDDYSGPFDPAFHLGRLSRRALAVLCREYMLAGHLQDRAGMPQVSARCGSKAMREVAIEEWMGASPIYTRRMQRALGFCGDDVATIFKGMQLDVGAPHQFMDFRFKVTDGLHGEFWLPYCGALMDVEPMGDKHVIGMCHQIEDPTFDATAVATNPRARMRPIHRPPRQPADRVPHCHWQVSIDPDAPPLTEIAATALVRQSRLAQVQIVANVGREPGGWEDYSGAFDPDFQFEDLAHPALTVAAQELCLQSHLLVRSFMTAIARRWGDDAAREIAAAQWVGIAALTAERLRAAMRIEGDEPAAIAKLLQLHPSFLPRAYVDFHVTVEGDSVCCWLGDCDGLNEGDTFSWFALLDRQPHRALEAMVRVINPRAQLTACALPGARLAWRVRIDACAEPAAEPPEVAITKISKGAGFTFTPRRPVRV